MLAQALIGTGNAKNADEAVGLLRTALTQEPRAADAHAQLAIAYARKGDKAHADLASAEAAFYRSDFAAATMLATRAKTQLPVGSPAWVRADDIVSAKPKKNIN
jgi:predicted Zn-dependent protease